MDMGMGHHLFVVFDTCMSELWVVKVLGLNRNKVEQSLEIINILCVQSQPSLTFRTIQFV